jgi:hypothetical protein
MSSTTNDCGKKKIGFGEEATGFGAKKRTRPASPKKTTCPTTTLGATITSAATTTVLTTTALATRCADAAFSQNTATRTKTSAAIPTSSSTSAAPTLASTPADTTASSAAPRVSEYGGALPDGDLRLAQLMRLRAEALFRAGTCDMSDSDDS